MAWDAALLQTKIELELITDQEVLTMIEKSKRGGLTFVGAKRYAKANNKQMGKENYDPKIESSYITYVDANNLYGWAMVQPLPYKDIKFVPCPPTSETRCPTSGTILEPDPATFRTRDLNPPTLEGLQPESATFRGRVLGWCPMLGTRFHWSPTSEGRDDWSPTSGGSERI